MELMHDIHAAAAAYADEIVAGAVTRAPATPVA
jgi:hypothetical protein